MMRAWMMAGVAVALTGAAAQADEYGYRAPKHHRMSWAGSRHDVARWHPPVRHFSRSSAGYAYRVPHYGYARRPATYSYGSEQTYGGYTGAGYAGGYTGVPLVDQGVGLGLSVPAAVLSGIAGGFASGGEWGYEGGQAYHSGCGCHNGWNF